MASCHYCGNGLVDGAMRCEGCGAPLQATQLADLRRLTSPRKHPARWLFYGVAALFLAPFALPLIFIALFAVVLLTQGWGFPLLIGGYFLHRRLTRNPQQS